MAQNQQKQPVQPTELCILIVDHSQEMRQLIRDMLSRMGIRRIHESRGIEGASQILDENRVHVVLVDWDLEPMSGLEVVRLLRDKEQSPNPFVPIIMLTGVADKDRVLSSRDAGVNEFLLKPLSSKMLADRINAAVNGTRAFVEGSEYFGPDRRRKDHPGYKGPDRRDN
jgi:two-component system chemotaxis response regulator CheY